MRRSIEYHDGLLREFALITAEDEAAAPHRLLRLIGSLREGFGVITTLGQLEVQAAEERGEHWAELVYRVPADVCDGARDLLELLDEADAYCRAGQSMLTLACPKDVLAFRTWLLREWVAQAGGARPTPWSEVGASSQ